MEVAMDDFEVKRWRQHPDDVAGIPLADGMAETVAELVVEFPEQLFLRLRARGELDVSVAASRQGM